MANYPENRTVKRHLRGDAKNIVTSWGWVTRYSLSAAAAAAASTTAVRAAVTDNGAMQEFWQAPTGQLITEKAVANTPSVAPTLTAAAGATALAAGTYQVAYAYRTANGLSSLSPATSVTLAATNQITVAALAAPPAAVLEVLYYVAGPVSTLFYFAGANAAGAAINLTTAPALSGLTDPPAPRNTSATTGGTTANITARQVIIYGISSGGNFFSETLPAFTAGAATTVAGNFAVRHILGIQVPANGVGVTTAVGFGGKLGLPDLLPHNTVSMAFLNNVLETVAPTVVTSTANMHANTVTLNSALNGTPVDIYYTASES